MTTWEERPPEIARLLNPAFCGELLRITIKEYCRESKGAFPFALSFFVLPLVLHSPTRKQLPAKQTMHAWLQENPVLRVGFADRIRQLVPFTRESLLFLSNANALTVTNEGGLTITEGRRRRSSIPQSDEINECFDKAMFIGRSLARAGGVTTIYAMWEIEP